MTLDGPTLAFYQIMDLKGVRIIGTNPGQPAQNAGLQSGDIIVALGRTFRRYYGYMGALKTLIVGQKTTITIVRMEQNKP